jgi:hypothetical protein
MQRHTGGALPIGEANASLDLQRRNQTNSFSMQTVIATISADTDDQIDFKAGGTDIMSHYCNH